MFEVRMKRSDMQKRSAAGWALARRSGEPAR